VRLSLSLARFLDFLTNEREGDSQSFFCFSFSRGQNLVGVLEKKKISFIIFVLFDDSSNSENINIINDNKLKILKTNIAD
jgi:hypothetical protein